MLLLVLIVHTLLLHFVGFCMDKSIKSQNRSDTVRSDTMTLTTLL